MVHGPLQMGNGPDRIILVKFFRLCKLFREKIRKFQQRILLTA